jgi:hypothetical protein
MVRFDGSKRWGNITLARIAFPLLIFRIFLPMPKAARTKHNVKPGKKVGRRGWTTEAQETWLTGRVKDFVEAQGKGNSGKKRKSWMISGPACGKGGLRSGQKRRWQVRMVQ